MGYDKETIKEFEAQKVAKLLESIKNNRFLKNDYEEIERSVERWGAIQGLIMYGASVASDVQEAIDCGMPGKETQRQWLNVVKGCMFAIEDYCDPTRHERKIGEPIPYF